MKNLRLITASLGITAALILSTHAAEAEPGFVDIGKLMPSAKGEFVEVNLSAGMLKFAAKIVAHEDPEVAELIGNLKRIRVNVVQLDDSNRKSTVEQIDSIRRKLESQGWTQVVTVREKKDGDNVDVHVKQRTDDVIDGLVVTVIAKSGEAVFVNIVGNINADQIAQVADGLDIKPLKHVRLRKKQAKDDEA